MADAAERQAAVAEAKARGAAARTAHFRAQARLDKLAARKAARREQRRGEAEAAREAAAAKAARARVRHARLAAKMGADPRLPVVRWPSQHTKRWLLSSCVGCGMQGALVERALEAVMSRRVDGAWLLAMTQKGLDELLGASAAEHALERAQQVSRRADRDAPANRREDPSVLCAPQQAARAAATAALRAASSARAAVQAALALQAAAREREWPARHFAEELPARASDWRTPVRQPAPSAQEELRASLARYGDHDGEHGAEDDEGGHGGHGGKGGKGRQGQRRASAVERMSRDPAGEEARLAAAQREAAARLSQARPTAAEAAAASAAEAAESQAVYARAAATAGERRAGGGRGRASVTAVIAANHGGAHPKPLPELELLVSGTDNLGLTAALRGMPPEWPTLPFKGRPARPATASLARDKAQRALAARAQEAAKWHAGGKGGKGGSSAESAAAKAAALAAMAAMAAAETRQRQRRLRENKKEGRGAGRGGRPAGAGLQPPPPRQRPNAQERAYDEQQARAQRKEAKQHAREHARWAAGQKAWCEQASHVPEADDAAEARWSEFLAEHRIAQRTQGRGARPQTAGV